MYRIMSIKINLSNLKTPKGTYQYFGRTKYDIFKIKKI